MKYFGTDGIRKIANAELTPEFAYKVAKAGAYVLSKHSNNKKTTILIGRDTRISGSLIESAMTAGFFSYGADVKLLGVISTPAVSYLTKKLNADAGVMISASHNRFDYNGIKFFSNKGMKIPDEIEEEIESIIDDDEKMKKLTASAENIGVAEDYQKLKNDYIYFLKDLFEKDFDKLEKQKFKVAIDVANGATYKITNEVFNLLKINHYIINNNPNGININENCGSTHLEMLKQYVKLHNFNLGIAYDGDGDRCLAVDKNGNEINGDIIMAIISKYMKENNLLKKNTLVSTVMSNLGLKKFGNNEKINIVQTKVGDRYVLENMINNGYNIGGEQSGHIIFLDYNPTGDGILTSLMLIKIILESKKDITELEKIIKIYPQVLVNAKVKNEKKYDFELDEEINKEILKLNDEFNGNGRVLIRASGTENLVRVMLEGEDLEYITKKATSLANLIERKLN